MKFSFNSLSNFINLKDFSNISNELTEKLSSCGFEVEEWTKKEYRHLVVGEIKEKKPHPSADRLSLCQVQSSSGKTHSIVCGATNFREGDKAILALPGAVLPGPLKIKVQKIRGEVSEGMLVSLNELGLASLEEKDSGIFLLPKETATGIDFASLAGGLNDTIFDINITPNRADCLSHFGMARELSCILKRPLKTSSLNEKTDFRLHINGAGVSTKKKWSVEVRQPKLCSRYAGRAIYGINVQPSPLWLKIYLTNLGFKSINNIVDITNYILIQWGQPLHAFDLDCLKDKIIVDYSQPGEIFKTLDNQEIQLTGKELCIRDGKGPLALAGVIGGVSSGIRSDTKNIFIESACFDPSHVRSTAKAFNIETDSSYLFSRGVPSESTLENLHRAIVLVQKWAGGEVSKDEYDFWKKSSKVRPIKIQKEDLERRLGMDVSFTKFQDWMRGLGCHIQTGEEKMGQKMMERAEVSRPFFRFDLNIKEDLIEEYARLEGYDKIPETISYLNDFPKEDQKEYTLSTRVARILAHEGFYQAINHSFISQKFSDSFLKRGTNISLVLKNSGFKGRADQRMENHRKIIPERYKITSFPKSESAIENKMNSPVFIRNPLSAEYNMMRLSLAPSLFKNAQQSIRHGCLKGRLFEIGKIFHFSHPNKDDQVASSTPTQRNKTKNDYKENLHLGLVAWGQKKNLWEKNQDRFCIYDLKTAVNILLDNFCIFNYEWVSVTPDEKSNSGPIYIPPFIHPYQYMVLKVRDKEMAYIGSLNPIYAEDYKVREDVALAEMDIQFLFDKIIEKKPFQLLSPFPVVERDLSLLVPKDFPAGHIIQGIQRLIGPICRDVEIFDIYENEKTLKNNTRSVTFRLTLQSNKKTLGEDDLKKLQDRLTKDLLSSYPVKLR
ncbi:MAG: phenylalanine--tRNA ligase subunit beta [Bdellovibrionales bacterium]|nr:phenylalanine--tRNA ligase subunit beta [Bdellovibrionales bacterium]